MPSTRLPSDSGSNAVKWGSHILLKKFTENLLKIIIVEN